MPCATAAQIFAGTDAGGSTVLSNFQSESTPQELIAAPVMASAPAAHIRPADAAIDRRADPRLPAGSQPVRAAARLRPIIDAVARESGLAPGLLHAVIAVESGFDARAVSAKGAQGLMQLMPATAQRFGVADPFDPRQNVAGGAAYLKWLLLRFDGDLPLALAAYNAGEGAVVRAGLRIPPFEETRAYVPRVLRHLKTQARF